MNLERIDSNSPVPETLYILVLFETDFNYIKSFGLKTRSCQVGDFASEVLIEPY